MKFFIPFLLLFFTSFSWSITFDWSGWTRVESYFQNTDKDWSLYGSYHLVGMPSIHIRDGLTVRSRLELSSLSREHLINSFPAYMENGLSFIYFENSEQRDLKLGDSFLKLSQVYIDYETEFFKMRLGRAPFHFGNGMTYMASESPFIHFLSVYNQLSFYFQHSQIYFQPSLLKEKGTFLGLAQAGFLDEDWKVEAFYRHSFYNQKTDPSLAEFFGQYKMNTWDLSASFSYAFQEEMQMALSLSAGLDITASSFPLKLKWEALITEGDFPVHPEYNLALLAGHRLLVQEGTSHTNQSADTENFKLYQGNKNQFIDGVYSTASLLVSFLNDKLQVRPLLFVGLESAEKKFIYELDLEGNYQLEENLFFSLKAGVLKKEKVHLGLLAQTAVSF